MKRSSKQPDKFSRHEVYDRAFTVLEMWSFVAEHPVVQADKRLSAEAEQVSDAIYRFYSNAAVKLMPHSEKKRRPRR